MTTRETNTSSFSTASWKLLLAIIAVYLLAVGLWMSASDWSAKAASSTPLPATASQSASLPSDDTNCLIYGSDPVNC
jgi:hypothetical protein